MVSASVRARSQAAQPYCRRARSSERLTAQPIRTTMMRKAMNPAASGQNMRRTIPAPPRLSVECYLLGCRGERPRHLERPLLPKHESELARRGEPLGGGGGEASAGGVAGPGAKEGVGGEAGLRACRRSPRGPAR